MTMWIQIISRVHLSLQQLYLLQLLQYIRNYGEQ